MSPEIHYEMNDKSPVKHKRSATISEFRSTTSGDSDMDQEQPIKFTKVQPYKVTRSKSVHAFQEYGKSFIGGSAARSSLADSPQSNMTPIIGHQQSKLQSTPPSLPPPIQPIGSCSFSISQNSLHQRTQIPLQPPPPPPPAHSSPFISNTIDDDNAQTSVSYSSNLLNYCQEGTPFPLPVVDGTANNDNGIRNATVIHHHKKNVSESDYNLNEISPISEETSCTKIERLMRSHKSESSLKESKGRQDKRPASSSASHFPFMDKSTQSSKKIFPNLKNDSDEDSFTSPISEKHFPELSGTTVLVIIIGLVLLICIMLGGFIPAVLILSKGTKSSVYNFFKDSKNLPILYSLSTKYLGTVDNLASTPKPNSVDGLTDELKQDIEVVALMNAVSNFMFHGIAYSPNNAMEPACGFTKRDAMLDLAKLSTVTTRIRNYGMQCDQSELILDAIEYMNLNMTLAMGVWIGTNDTVNKEQMDLMKKVVSKYPEPSRLINSIYIGNEVLFREDKTRAELLDYIQDAKDFLRVMHIDDIPVGTSEIGSLVDSDLLSSCDVVGANIHPFFAGVPVEYAAAWTLEFLNLQVQPYNERDTQIVLSEVGWPSGGGTFGEAVASFANLQYFVGDFLCTLRDMPVEYYYFEGFDEPWKEIFWEGNQRWETQWGIFHSDRSSKFNLQNIGCV